MRKIDLVLRSVLTSDKIFGGIRGIILIGDHAQLRPVKQIELYFGGVTNKRLANEGLELFKKFDECILLDEIWRSPCICNGLGKCKECVYHGHLESVRKGNVDHISYE